MVAMGRGGGKTPERVVELINDEVAKFGQNGVARSTGLPLRSIQKYMLGNSEPTQATLEKLAGYFGVTVAWLRGEYRETPSLVIELLEKDGEAFTDSGLKPITIKLLLDRNAEPNEATLQELSDYYCISKARLRGDEPNKYALLIKQFKYNLDEIGAYLDARKDFTRDNVIELCEAVEELELSLSDLSNKISDKMSLLSG